MEIIRKNGKPHMVGKNFELPLIMNVAKQVSQIIGVGNEEINSKFRQVSNYIINEENFQRPEYSYKSVIGLYEILVTGSQYLDEIDYEVLSHIQPEHLFGFVKYCPIRAKDMLELYVMNDITPLMWAHKSKDPDEFKCFQFYEEDFWSIAEPIFKDIKIHFGGFNMARRYQDPNFVTYYRPGNIFVDSFSRNPHQLPEEDFISSSESFFRTVEMTPVSEVLGRYDFEKDTITTFENDMLIENQNKPFTLFEDKNLATIYTFASYQRFKYHHYKKSSYEFMPENEMPIDWYPSESLMYEGEKPVRFTVEKGRLYDHDLKSHIPIDHAANILNLFEDQLRDLNKSYAKLEGQMELFEDNE